MYFLAQILGFDSYEWFTGLCFCRRLVCSFIQQLKRAKVAVSLQSMRLSETLRVTRVYAGRAELQISAKIVHRHTCAAASKVKVVSF